MTFHDNRAFCAPGGSGLELVFHSLKSTIGKAADWPVKVSGCGPTRYGRGLVEGSVRLQPKLAPGFRA